MRSAIHMSKSCDKVQHQHSAKHWNKIGIWGKSGVNSSDRKLVRVYSNGGTGE